jgi:hypothetical protein
MLTANKLKNTAMVIKILMTKFGTDPAMMSGMKQRRSILFLLGARDIQMLQREEQ